MRNQLTPTPWAVAFEDKSYILDAQGVIIARVYYFEGYSNSQHIVDCVNACEGQDIETVKLATAHRNDCLELEKTNEMLIERNERLRSALQGLINAVNPLDRLRTLDHAEVDAINDANQLLVELAQEGGAHE